MIQILRLIALYNFVSSAIGTGAGLTEEDIFDLRDLVFSSEFLASASMSSDEAPSTPVGSSTLHEQVYSCTMELLQAVTWIHMSDYIIYAPFSDFTLAEMAIENADFVVANERDLHDFCAVTQRIAASYSRDQLSHPYPGILNDNVDRYMAFLKIVLRAATSNREHAHHLRGDAISMYSILHRSLTAD